MPDDSPKSTDYPLKDKPVDECPDLLFRLSRRRTDFLKGPADEGNVALEAAGQSFSPI
jgi:hypothetical protein